MIKDTIDTHKKLLSPEEIAENLIRLRDKAWEKSRGKRLPDGDLEYCLNINSCLYRKNSFMSQ